MVRIFSDSTCDLSEELIKKYHIGIIPLYIILSCNEYRDGVDISPDEIYSWSEKTKLSPKTSSPSVSDVTEALMPALSEGDDIILFSVSGEMSSTADIFRYVAEEYGQDRIYVIDSRNLSTGVGLLIIKAAEMALDGMPARQITENINELIPRIRASFIVDTLDYLHRGGRCSGISALAGGALRIHPKIVVKDGKMTPEKKYRGNIARSTVAYVKDMEEDLLCADPSHVFITHSGCDEALLLKVCSMIDSMDHFENIHITRAGGVISSHCGPGTLGVLYIASR